MAPGPPFGEARLAREALKTAEADRLAAEKAAQEARRSAEAQAAALPLKAAPSPSPTTPGTPSNSTAATAAPKPTPNTSSTSWRSPDEIRENLYRTIMSRLQSRHFTSGIAKSSFEQSEKIKRTVRSNELVWCSCCTMQERGGPRKTVAQYQNRMEERCDCRRCANPSSPSPARLDAVRTRASLGGCIRMPWPIGSGTQIFRRIV